MKHKEKMVIAGAALVTAVAGGSIAFKNFGPYFRQNIGACRQRAINYVMESTGYDRLTQDNKLPDSVIQITRGSVWRGVDYVVGEAIAREGSRWAEVPERMFGEDPAFARFARVEERVVDPRLEGLYLQRIHFFPTGLNRELLQVLRESTLLERITNPSETYLVGIHQTFIDPATLERISMGISQPR